MVSSPQSEDSDSWSCSLIPDLSTGHNPIKGQFIASRVILVSVDNIIWANLLWTLLGEWLGFRFRIEPLCVSEKSISAVGFLAWWIGILLSGHAPFSRIRRPEQ